MRDARPQINKLLKRLQKKYSINTAPIQIKNFIGRQDPDKNAGEFGEQKAEHKDNSNTIHRMVHFVEQISEHAAKSHLKNNFEYKGEYLLPSQLRTQAQSNLLTNVAPTSLENEIHFLRSRQPKLKLRAERSNCLTLLTLPENALYTASPLTLEDFNNLIVQLNELASLLPENLHLQLGTLALAVTDSEIKNVGLYIECGSKPKIHVFAKAFPHKKDYQYPHKINTPAIQLTDTTYKLHTLYKSINFFSGRMSESEIKELSMLLSLVNSENALYGLAPEEQKSFIESIHSLSSLASGISTRFSDRSYQCGNFQFEEDWELLCTQLGKIVNKLHKSTQDIAPTWTTFKGDFNVQFGANFSVETAAGAKLQVITDICYDHTVEVGRRSFSNLLQLSRRKGMFQPTQTAYSLISDSIFLQKDKTIGSNILHADRLKELSIERKKNVLKSTEHKIDKPAFGSSIAIEEYPEYKLTPLPARLSAEFNQFLMKLEALRFYQAQHPSDFHIINRMIIYHITKPLLSALAQNMDIAEEPIKSASETLINLLLGKETSFQPFLSVLEDLSNAIMPFSFNTDLKFSTQMAWDLLRSEEQSSKALLAQIEGVTLRELKDSMDEVFVNDVTEQATQFHITLKSQFKR